MMKSMIDLIQKRNQTESNGFVLFQLLTVTALKLKIGQNS